jgi:hypothetical protein
MEFLLVKISDDSKTDIDTNTPKTHVQSISPIMISAFENFTLIQFYELFEDKISASYIIFL